MAVHDSITYSSCDLRPFLARNASFSGVYKCKVMPASSNPCSQYTLRRDGLISCNYSSNNC